MKTWSLFESPVNSLIIFYWRKLFIIDFDNYVKGNDCHSLSAHSLFYFSLFSCSERDPLGLLVLLNCNILFICMTTQHGSREERPVRWGNNEFLYYSIIHYYWIIIHSVINIYLYYNLVCSLYYEAFFRRLFSWHTMKNVVLNYWKDTVSPKWSHLC